MPEPMLVGDADMPCTKVDDELRTKVLLGDSGAIGVMV